MQADKNIKAALLAALSLSSRINLIAGRLLFSRAYFLFRLILQSF